nr:hypothetical protein CFP56_21062 [Quercus suber]
MPSGLPPQDYANPTAFQNFDQLSDIQNQGLGPPGTNIQCAACRTVHMVSLCPLKLAGPEFCNLCGIAHFGQARVRLMLEALKSSTEPPHVIAEAKRYLRGLKGNLVAMKRQRDAKEHASRVALLGDEASKRSDEFGRGFCILIAGVSKLVLQPEDIPWRRTQQSRDDPTSQLNQRHGLCQLLRGVLRMLLMSITYSAHFLPLHALEQTSVAFFPKSFVSPSAMSLFCIPDYILFELNTSASKLQLQPAMHSAQIPRLSAPPFRILTQSA